jgi:Protein of unknown function (DUF3455)
MNTKPLLYLAGAAALTVGAATLAAAAGAVELSLTDALSPAPGEQRAFTLGARGVQIYECRAAAAAGAALSWSFVAPEAELFDADGRSAGTHGAGPSWQARDGSRVVGAVKQRGDAPQPGAIPWLLLSASGRDSAGLFGGVSSIQRVNTRGGSAPSSTCPGVGQVLRVPYTADYHFYRVLDRRAPAVVSGSGYPAPQIDAAAPLPEPSPTF